MYYVQPPYQGPTPMQRLFERYPKVVAKLRDLIEENGLDYADNLRIAKADDSWDRVDYDAAASRGCCGTFEKVVTIDGIDFIGLNTVWMRCTGKNAHSPSQGCVKIHKSRGQREITQPATSSVPITKTLSWNNCVRWRWFNGAVDHFRRGLWTASRLPSGVHGLCGGQWCA